MAVVTVTFKLDWATGDPWPDLDLYVYNATLGGLCGWSGNAGGFTLDQDAYPDCYASPDPPENITNAGLSLPTEVYVYYGQNSGCGLETSPFSGVNGRSMYIDNSGGSTVYVYAPGASPTHFSVANGDTWSGFVDYEYAGFESKDYPLDYYSWMTPSNTTSYVHFSDDPDVCWTLTAMTKDGRPFWQHGPARMPSVIVVPGNVDLSTCRIFEDGRLVPRRRYQIKRSYE
jgi:hypothetical protein